MKQKSLQLVREMRGIPFFSYANIWKNWAERRFPKILSRVRDDLCV